MSTALATRPATRANVVNFKADRNIEQHMRALNQNKRELDSINKHVKKFLGLQMGWSQTAFSRLFGWVVPKKMYEIMPASIVKWVAEEADVLEQIEGMMRECINNNQEAVANIANCAIAESDALDQFVADIEKAESENWDARKLQEYMADESNISINPAIAELLDKKFNVFTESQREAKKSEILEQLRILALTRRKMIETLGQACDAGLVQLNATIGQYYAYSRVYRPTAVIRNSARDMLQTDHSLYGARQALMTTIQASMNAIDNIIKSAGAVNEYHIASTDFHRVLDEGVKRIDAGLADLEKRESGKRITLITSISAKPAGQLPATIDVVKMEKS